MSKRSQGLLAAACIVALTAAAYIPAYRAGSIWDDDNYLTENEHVQSWGGLADIWFTTRTPQYYPLVFTSFWIEHKLWGVQQLAGYHVVNVLLHALNAILVWRIARRLKIPAAWFIGAVFAVHPVHVESVAWITERKNVLSGLFYLLALGAYLRFDETDRWRHYGGAGALLIAALLSKTVTAMLPAALPFILFYKNGRITARKLAVLTPLLAVAAGFGLFTAYLEKGKVGAEGVEFMQSFLERTLILAPSAYCFYAAKIAGPYPLIFNYPRWDVDAGQWAQYIPAVMLALALVVAFVGARRFGWGPLILLLFSGITLFPTLGFLNVYPHRFSFVADHFQYLGSLGFIVLFVIVGIRLGRGLIRATAAPGVGRVVGAAALLTLGALTFHQSLTYQNAERLWRDTLDANPQSWLAMNNLGVIYRDRGDTEDAVALFKRASRYPYAAPEAHFNLGYVRAQQNRHGQAITRYRDAIAARQALGVKQVYPEAATNLGDALLAEGRIDEAAATLEAALAEWPDEYAQMWLNLAAVRETQGRLDELEVCLRKAIAIESANPNHQRAYGEFLFQQGRFREAVPYLRFAVNARKQGTNTWLAFIASLIETGRYAECLRACKSVLATGKADVWHLERTVWLLATCPDDRIHDGREAQRLAERLRSAVGADPPPPMLRTFAAVAAERGDFEAAVTLTQQALTWAQALNDSARVASIGEQLAAYARSRPYRHRPSQPGSARGP